MTQTTTPDIDGTLRWLYQECGLPFHHTTDTAIRAALAGLCEHARAEERQRVLAGIRRDALTARPTRHG